MKSLNMSLIAIATIAVIPAVVSAQAPECQGVTVNTKAVALAAPRVGPLLNFTGSGGLLDPVPLLETNISVFGLPARPVCVTVTFSVQADPGDNYGVYQASIDNVPMSGHGSLFPEYGYATPIVFDAVNQGAFIPIYPLYAILNAANSRMVSYTFFASLLPGTHTIRIRAASCCSPVLIGGAYVRAATLVARW